MERRDVGYKRRDVGKFTLWNVATLPRTSRRCPVLRPHISHFALLTLYHPYLNPSLPAHPSTPPIAGVSPHTGRRPVFCPPTPSLPTTVTITPSQSPIPASHSHAPLRYSRTGRVIHLRSRGPYLGSHLGSHLGLFQVGLHLGSLVHLVSLCFT